MTHEHLSSAIDWRTPTFWIRRSGCEDELSTRPSIRNKFSADIHSTEGVVIVNQHGESAPVEEFICEMFPALVQPYELAHSLAYHRRYRESWTEETREKHLFRLTALLRVEFRRLRLAFAGSAMQELFSDTQWSLLVGQDWVTWVSRYYEALGFQVRLIASESHVGADLLAYTSLGVQTVRAVDATDVAGIDAVQQVFAAAAFHQCARSGVMTNGCLSLKAAGLAAKIGVGISDTESISNRHQQLEIMIGKLCKELRITVSI
jgi:hypothetical protein